LLREELAWLEHSKAKNLLESDWQQHKIFPSYLKWQAKEKNVCSSWKGVMQC
jgi:hypothetical protein